MTTLKRKDLVSAAKDLNVKLGLEPEIETKAGKEDKHLKDMISEAGQLVDSEQDELEENTWTVLNTLGVTVGTKTGEEAEPEEESETAEETKETEQEEASVVDEEEEETQKESEPEPEVVEDKTMKKKVSHKEIISAAKILNDSGLASVKVKTVGIKTEDLKESFSSATETIPEEKEEEIPDEVAEIYNALRDEEESEKTPQPKAEKPKEKPAEKNKKSFKKEKKESRPAMLRRKVAEFGGKEKVTEEMLFEDKELLEHYAGRKNWIRSDLKNKVE